MESIKSFIKYIYKCLFISMKKHAEFYVVVEQYDDLVMVRPRRFKTVLGIYIISKTLPTDYEYEDIMPLAPIGAQVGSIYSDLRTQVI